MHQYLIIVRGPPAIGKSTIVKELAQKLPSIVSVINIDTLRWDFIPKRPKSFNDHEIVYKNLKDIVNNSLKAGINVVIEGILASKDKKGNLRVNEFSKLRKKGVQVINIYLKGTKDVQKKRFQSRSKKYTAKITSREIKEWSDLSNKSISKKDIIIDTTNESINSIVDKIFQLIKNKQENA